MKIRTYRKILPIPGLFPPIDFAGHYQHLDSLRSALGLVGTRISTWITTTTANSSEYEFLTQMQKYVLALLDTISQLSGICLNMSDMSQAEHIYSPVAYKQDTRAYKDSVVRYRHLGTCLNALQREGKMVKTDVVPVHVLHVMNGYTIQHWTIGEDIDAEAVEGFRDSESGAIYALIHFENGEEVTHLMAKHLWEESRRKLGAVGW